MKNPQVQELIRKLQDQFNRSLEILDEVDDQDLTLFDSHGCAVGKTLGGLIAHNIEHDRMHSGQIATKRWELNEMQSDSAHRLIAELCRERALLISTLIGLPDEALDRASAEGETTIREVVDHVLFWESDSMEHAAKNVLNR